MSDRRHRTAVEREHSTVSHEGVGPTVRRLAVGFTGEQLWIGARCSKREESRRHGSTLEDGWYDPALSRPNILNSESIRDLLHDAFDRLGVRPRGLGAAVPVSLVVPDVTVRLAVVDLEQPVKGSADADAIAAWALKDRFPSDVGELRIDWSVFGQKSATEGTSLRLAAMGAVRAVIDEYESMIDWPGLSVDRVVPWTVALAAARSGEPLGAESLPRAYLHGTDTHTACLVFEGGIPRFHRAWRRGLRSPGMEGEMERLYSFVQDNLSLRVSEIEISVPESWERDSIPAVESLSWQVTRLDAWEGMEAVLRE